MFAAVDDPLHIGGRADERSERLAGLAVSEHRQFAAIDSLPYVGIQGDLTEKRGIDLLGERPTPAVPEDAVGAPAVGTLEPRHVLDDTEHRRLVFGEHL